MFVCSKKKRDVKFLTFRRLQETERKAVALTKRDETRGEEKRRYQNYGAKRSTVWLTG